MTQKDSRVKIIVISNCIGDIIKKHNKTNRLKNAVYYKYVKEKKS